MPAERMLRWFDHQLVQTLAPGPERTVALRKLLESKDAADRAALEEKES